MSNHLLSRAVGLFLMWLSVSSVFLLALLTAIERCDCVAVELEIVNDGRGELEISDKVQEREYFGFRISLI